MPKKKEEELKPKIIEVGNTDIDTDSLKEIGRQIEQSTVTAQRDDSPDSYFRQIVNSLDKNDTISTNTEYLSVTENFTGTKLEFLSQFAYMPFLKNFVNIFETKRVSLERKGRIEKIKALQERHQEIKTERLQNFARMFEMG